MSNILWQNLSVKELNNMIRTWPVDETKVPKVTKKAKVKIVAAPRAVQAEKSNHKYAGADGEIKFIEHRSIYVGFFGGKPVAKSKTEAGCRAILKRVYNV
jgi:hypothetical protein